MIPSQTISQTLQAMLEQVSRLQETPSALDRDLLLSRIRTLYQRVLELEVATAEQLKQAEEEFSPEIEVEFEFNDGELDEDEDQDPNEDRQQCDTNKELPCPHHDEAPLSALVSNIEQEINEPEETKAQAFHTQEQDCKAEHQTIELIAAEITEVRPDEPSPCDKMQQEEPQAQPPEQPSEQPETRVILFGQPISQATYLSFVDELFDTDSVLYTEQTARLGAMESLDDALIFISENYSWHPQSPVAQLFITLLEERYN